MDSIEVSLATGSRLVNDVTARVREFASERADGLVHLFLPHATAGLALVETGSGTEEDLAAAVDRLLPADVPYRHRHGAPAHGRDHVLPAFCSPSLVLPVLGGRLALGPWQSVVVVDSNGDNPRRSLRMSFLAG